MAQNVFKNVSPEVIRRKELEDEIQMLRAEGKTFRAIGILTGISEHKARYLFLGKTRRRDKPPSWTDGLNERLANSLRWLGFQGCEDVEAALKSGHLQTLSSLEPALRGTAIVELTQWLYTKDRMKNSPGKTAMSAPL